MANIVEEFAALPSLAGSIGHWFGFFALAAAEIAWREIGKRR